MRQNCKPKLRRNNMYFFRNSTTNADQWMSTFLQKLNIHLVSVGECNNPYTAPTCFTTLMNRRRCKCAKLNEHLHKRKPRSSIRPSLHLRLLFGKTWNDQAFRKLCYKLWHGGEIKGGVLEPWRHMTLLLRTNPLNNWPTFDDVF